jgi:hypothetical protein
MNEKMQRKLDGMLRRPLTDDDQFTALLVCVVAKLYAKHGSDSKRLLAGIVDHLSNDTKR